TACRLLVVQIVDQQLATGCRPPGSPIDRGNSELNKRMNQALQEFRMEWEERWPKALRAYQFTLIKASPSRPDEILDPISQQRLKEFREKKNKTEDPQPLLSQGKYLYFGAVRATPSCVSCHRQMRSDLAENDLLAVIKIEVPTEPIEEEMHANRALLITTA